MTLQVCVCCYRTETSPMSLTIQVTFFLFSPWDLAWCRKELCCKFIYLLKARSYLKLQTSEELLTYSWSFEMKIMFPLFYFILLCFCRTNLLSLFGFQWSSQSDKCSHKGGLCRVTSAVFSATPGQVYAYRPSTGKGVWAGHSRKTIFR